MRTGTYLTIIAVLLVSFVQALAQDADAPATQPAPATRPARTAPDLLTGGIDPYHGGAERMAFFQAAGVDNEFDADEFAAARKAGVFVRPYDRWKAMLAFDKNRSATLDWFEAKAYRGDIRRRVLAAFDTDKDGRLAGAERAAANEVLAAGKVPGEPPARPGKQVHIPDETDEADRRGPESQPTTQPARRRGGMGEAMAKWRLKHFDTDGDGEIGPAEQEEVEKFQKQIAGIGRDFRRHMADLNGDGEVSDEERQEARKQWMAAGMKMFARAVRYMDTDGDGQISSEERRDFGRRMQEGTARFIENFSESFDADASGRLDAEERDRLVAGMSKELERRSKAFDADEDGRLSPDEMMTMMEDFVQKDIGIVPTEREEPEEGGE